MKQWKYHWNYIKHGWKCCNHSTLGRLYYLFSVELDCIESQNDDDIAWKAYKKVAKIRKLVAILILKAIECDQERNDFDAFEKPCYFDYN